MPIYLKQTYTQKYCGGIHTRFYNRLFREINYFKIFTFLIDNPIKYIHLKRIRSHMLLYNFEKSLNGLKNNS